MGQPKCTLCYQGLGEEGVPRNPEILLKRNREEIEKFKRMARLIRNEIQASITPALGFSSKGHMASASGTTNITMADLVFSYLYLPMEASP
jgi:hypothetical protein